MKVIILVCMVDSIHVARWIENAAFKDEKVVLFASGPNRRVHPRILEQISQNQNIELMPFSAKYSVIFWALDKVFGGKITSRFLRRLIESSQPVIVHALEFQHSGYLCLNAFRGLKVKNFTFHLTNYGSDIFWYQRFPSHSKKIKELLSIADGYSAECTRDVGLALKLGFRGRIFEVFPNAGGFPEELLNRTLPKTSERRLILVKGYDGWVGRARYALAALFLLRRDLDSFKIVIYSANLKIKVMAFALGLFTKLDFKVYGKSSISHDEMIQLFSKARLYIGVSLSDGISTSLLEAMASGAFPMQTSTACIDDWFKDGESGISLHSTNPKSIAQQILSVIGDSKTLDSGTKINLETIRKRASIEEGKALIRQIYDV